ncbi:hypothetical protein NFI96_033667 [Prochilodus magdalenae]|nr:hypothetical protein NFI96_033667 [Prochilodus magdalenae]
MTVWYDTTAVFGDGDVVLRTVVVTVCVHVVLRGAAVCRWCCTNRMTHGGHHCSLEVCSGGVGSVSMADKEGKAAGQSEFAKRINPEKEQLTREQLQFIRQAELAQWKKRSQKLRGRNLITGLAIGGIVLGIYGYTFYSVSQERIMDELDEEAKKAAKYRAPKTGAN